MKIGDRKNMNIGETGRTLTGLLLFSAYSLNSTCAHYALVQTTANSQLYESRKTGERSNGESLQPVVGQVHVNHVVQSREDSDR